MPYRRLDGSTAYWPPIEIPSVNTSPPINANVVSEINEFNPGVFVIYSYFGYVDPSYRLRAPWVDTDKNGRANFPDEYFDDINGNGALDDHSVTPDPYPNDPAEVLHRQYFFNPANTSGNNPKRPDPREPSTIPWPWPKMVRITMNLVDPTEPAREQTFQFILDVPQIMNDASQ